MASVGYCDESRRLVVHSALVVQYSTMNIHERLFHNLLGSIALLAVAAALLAACGNQTPTPTAGPTSTSQSGGGEATNTPASTMGPTSLKYVVLAKYAGNNNLLYCDRDHFPLEVSPEEEQRRAEAKLPEIQADQEKYQAILQNNNLGGAASLSPEQTLLIYRESKKLDAVAMEPEGASYRFGISAGTAANVNEGAGIKHTGLIDGSGTITGEQQQDVSVQCPICLAGDTFISTPDGPVRVRDMREGMLVWTLDKRGDRIPATVLMAVKRTVTAPYRMVHLALRDGRELYVSPGHPLVDGRPVGALQAGDVIDGVPIGQIEDVPYSEGATYDILPSGETGFYIANDIPLASTLTPNPAGRR